MLDKLFALLPDWFHQKEPVVPTPPPPPVERALVDYIEGPPESRGEATALLEKNNYCLKHLVPMKDRWASLKYRPRDMKPSYECPICVQELVAEYERKEKEKARQIEKAVAILDGTLRARPDKVINPVGLPYYPDGDTINERTPVPTEEVTNA